MAHRLFPGTFTNKAGCLKTVFLFMLVFLIGLLMGTYFKVSNQLGTRVVYMPLQMQYAKGNGAALNSGTTSLQRGTKQTSMEGQIHLNKVTTHSKVESQGHENNKEANVTTEEVQGHAKKEANVTKEKVQGQPKKEANVTKEKVEGQPKKEANVTKEKVEGHLKIEPIVIKAEGRRHLECTFPDLDPFDPKIKKFVKKHPTFNCTDGIPSIVDVIGDEVKVDPEKVKVKLKTKPSALECKYRSLSMAPLTDYKVTYGAWSKAFSTSIRLGRNDTNLVVDCYSGKKLVSRSYVALVRKKEDVEKKRQDSYQAFVKQHAPKETLSVLLVGVDGTSKQNFVRSCPKTKEFVTKKLGAIEFHKFNKVGLNTFPNVIPMLTGLSDPEFRKARNWTNSIPFDKMDDLFLWSDYQKAGYRTAIILDRIYVTAFHYTKNGWHKPQFDFYPRPILVASEPDKTFRPRSNCMGDTPEVTVLHDYWVQLATAYNNSASTPYFGYSFMARATHDDQNLASAVDELYLKFFQELEAKRFLNNTLVVFFSDHGERFGAIRTTYNGLVEAKTPFLFFMFPPWFEKKYPDVMRVFRKNTDRLMTMFDVHATLKDLLPFTGKSRKVSPLDRGISFFSEIPQNRSCSNAGIPLKFCACTSVSRDNVTSSNVTSHLVSQFVEHLVSQTKKHRDKCQVLKHKATLHVLAMTPEFPLSNKNESLYHVTIQTTPGDAVYEASVTFNSVSKAVKVSTGVARLNMYKGQAECMDDSILRPFCYCVDKKKKS